jgi:hypothetical protein
MEYLECLLKHGLVAKSLVEDRVQRIMLMSKGIDSYCGIVAWIKETLDGVKI